MSRRLSITTQAQNEQVWHATFSKLAKPKPWSSAVGSRGVSPYSRGRSWRSSRCRLCPGRAALPEPRCAPWQGHTGTGTPVPRHSQPRHFPGSPELPPESTSGPVRDRPRPARRTPRPRPGGAAGRGGARRPPRPILGDAGMFTGLPGAVGGGEWVGAAVGVRAARQEPR